jgi:hypothetical protein
MFESYGARTLRGNAETSLVPPNQEDSLVISQGAVDRGLFNGCKFTYYKDDLEQREEFGNPDAATTSDIKSGSYAKLKDGIIKIGSKVNKGDAIIGKYMRIPKTNDQEMTMTDKSTIYKENEEAIVHNVIVDRNEEDERFCKVAIRKVRPVAIGDKFCLTGDHEVLTVNGWKNITEVTTNDYVATLNQETNHIEFQNPTDVPNFDHNGKMYSVQAGGVDLVTTMNHKMYIRYQNSEYKLEESKNIQGMRVYYKKDGINNIEDEFEFILPSTSRMRPDNMNNIIYEEKSVDMDSWLEFLGIYLAEGWVDNSKCVRIAIHKERVKSKLLEILPNLGYDYKIYETEPDYMYIRNLQLSSYMIQFGKSYNKFIPTWCYTLSRRQSSLLLNGLLLGDGYYDIRRGSWEYYTGSKKLADGVQILAFMSEQTARMSIKNLEGEEVYIKGIKTKRNSNQYRIYISNYQLNKEPLVGGKNTDEKLIDYTGKVYCITVPNHVFLTRRNFTYVWTGNSSRAGLTNFWPEWSIKDVLKNIWKSLLVINRMAKHLN